MPTLMVSVPSHPIKAGQDFRMLQKKSQKIPVYTWEQLVIFMCRSTFWDIKAMIFWFMDNSVSPTFQLLLLYLSGPQKLWKINLQRPCCSSLGSFSWKKKWEVGKAHKWEWINRILSFFGWIWAALKGFKTHPTAQRSPHRLQFASATHHLAKAEPRSR